MPAPEIAGRRQWLALAVLALPCFVYAMDLTVLNLAVPSISAELHPSSAAALWLLDIYGFMVAGSLITMGALGDRIGARRLLMAGAAAFAGASILGGLAQTTGMLIAARALLGVAGATIAPTTLALIRGLFEDERRRATAIGLWVAAYSLGAAIGPVVGGIVIDGFGWRGIFVMPLPVMALLLVLAPRLLPERREARPAALDIASAALSLAAVLLVVFGLKRLAIGGSAAPAVALLAAGVSLGVAFARRQLRLEEPLIDLRLFRRTQFSVALGSSLTTFFVLGGLGLFVVQFLQSVLGLSPLEAGLLMLPEATAFIAGSIVAPRVAARLGVPSTLAASAALGAAGYLLVAQGHLAAVVGGTTLGGLGVAAIITLVTDVAVGAVAPEHAGAAAATSETSSELGGALGLALLGSLGAAVYRAALPAGVPHAARETVGAAVGVGHDTALAAADAFARALSVTAVAGGLLMLAVAVVVTVTLVRPQRPALAPAGC